jgi:phenylacetate-CoA ligase
MECEAHAGLHLREDYNDVEVVDAHDNPVPEGTTGAALLVTSWLNPTLPIIRYRLDDQAAITSEPCRCGRASRRILNLTGRVEDTVRLAARGGGHVDVHPNHFEETIEGWPGVGQYQVRHRADGITISVVATPDPPEHWDDRLVRALEERLGDIGAEPPAIRVDTVTDLPRPDTAGAKLQIVRSEV